MEKGVSSSCGAALALPNISAVEAWRTGCPARHADRLQQPRRADRIDLGGEDRLLEGQRHEALRREVVDLVRPRRLDGADEVRGLQQVQLDRLDGAGDAQLPQAAVPGGGERRMAPTTR
jgi:hypothetical protein